MSVKDKRYSCPCPICGDDLPGTDDGPMVYEALSVPGECMCTLCGEEVDEDQRAAILAKGPPVATTPSGVKFVEGTPE